MIEYVVFPTVIVHFFGRFAWVKVRRKRNNHSEVGNTLSWAAMFIFNNTCALHTRHPWSDFHVMHNAFAWPTEWKEYEIPIRVETFEGFKLVVCISTWRKQQLVHYVRKLDVRGVFIRIGVKLALKLYGSMLEIFFNFYSYDFLSSRFKPARYQGREGTRSNTSPAILDLHAIQHDGVVTVATQVTWYRKTY